MRESDIERYLVEQVNALGGEIRKVKWIGRRGAPDRVVMFPHGDLVWVELKAPGKGLKPHQEREHHRLQRMGQDVRKLDNKRDVDELLTERKWRRYVCSRTTNRGVAGCAGDVPDVRGGK